MPAYFVTGATGQQGGGVARALLSSGHQVHALVRDAASPKSQALSSLGATLFPGSFSDLSSLQAAAAGTLGLFLNGTPSLDPTSELTDARNIIAASLAAGVKHIIYTSVINAGHHESFPGWSPDAIFANYWISKGAIENAVREAPFETWTIIRPGNFMTNFFPPWNGIMYPELATEGLFKSAYKLGTKLHLVDPEDVGKVALQVFEDPQRWSGRVVDVLAEKTTVEETARVLGEVSGKRVRVETVGDGEAVEGWLKASVLENQRLSVRLDEDGRFEPELEPLGELGIVLTGWREYLERKKAEGVLGQSVGGE